MPMWWSPISRGGEGLYVDAVAALARIVEPDLFQVHDVEFWDTASDRAAHLELADVLDSSAVPGEGEPVAGARLDNLVRRCLRDVAWFELLVSPKLLVHFGHDLRIIVASSIPLAAPLGPDPLPRLVRVRQRRTATHARGVGACSCFSASAHGRDRRQHLPVARAVTAPGQQRDAARRFRRATLAISIPGLRRTST